MVLDDILEWFNKNNLEHILTKIESVEHNTSLFLNT